MWNIGLPIANVNVYEFSLWFLIYSVLGWIVESIYMSICNKKLTNRGFVRGPICPIYGFGGTFIHIALKSIAYNKILLYIAGMLLATTIEFLVAKMMIKFLGYVWWDYTNKPFNYKGILCLESSLGWGLYTILEFNVLHKITFMVIDRIPVLTGKVIVLLALLYYFTDMLICLIKVKHGDIEENENNLMHFQQ